VRLPDRVLLALERTVAAQRKLRRDEDHRRAQARLHAIEGWARRARAAHGDGRCVADCPFLH
jgi:hypothetical protein